MGAELPEISQEEFSLGLHEAAARLRFPERGAQPSRLLADRVATCGEALWRHYQELRRWNRRTSLVGPGTAGDAWSRHYGEALAAVPLLADAPFGPAHAPRRALVDLGSGAGFPGFVLAAALPELDVTLVDARERKWAFLQHAARRAQVPCRCLHLRVDLPLPEELPARIDVLTLRALKLPPEVMDQLARRMPPGAKLLSWQAGTDPIVASPPVSGDSRSGSEPSPAGPTPGFRPGRVILLPGSDRRFVVESIREA
jgi:16S rRNA (guanine527-N7)-methyltransferase